MTLEELTVGVIYKCRLTSRLVLIIEQDRKTSDAADAAIEKVKLGKWVNHNRRDDGTNEVTYLYQEIFDGQLEEIEPAIKQS